MKSHDELKRLIVISPEILGGTPVFRNTRVPVKNLFDYLKAGDSLFEFLENFPSVDKKVALKVLDLAEYLVEHEELSNETAA
ncbi:MAG: DUF433 domain-containing protein [Cyclobacteriaceae bacterium]|nr:DUF433 domain-containing protein [Cyclobacteriaceae bacterium]